MLPFSHWVTFLLKLMAHLPFHWCSSWFLSSGIFFWKSAFLWQLKDWVVWGGYQRCCAWRIKFVFVVWIWNVTGREIKRLWSHIAEGAASLWQGSNAKFMRGGAGLHQRCWEYTQSPYSLPLSSSSSSSHSYHQYSIVDKNVVVSVLTFSNMKYKQKTLFYHWHINILHKTSLLNLHL